MHEQERKKRRSEGAEDFSPKNRPPAFLWIEHLRAGYGSSQVLKDVSFQAGPGTLTGLLGPNGCGKTTLFRALCRQLPYTGVCICGGQSLTALSGRALAQQISYIPQRTGISISLPVLDVVLMGFNPRLGLLQRPTKSQEARAFEALASVGMADFAAADYQKLSEGQKQLCILARTAVEDAPMLLLDEPESALDFSQRRRMMRLLCGLLDSPGAVPPDGFYRADASASGPASPKTALVALHDPALALEYCHQLVLLRDGVCSAVLYPASDELSHMERALSDIYGPVRLKDFPEDGKRRLVLLPEN